MEEINKAYATFRERDRIASLGGGGCVKSKHQVFFDILYKKGNALYLFILVFLLLSFGK